jgi:hypothetical protein
MIDTDETGLGPAMASLNPMQRAFVAAKVHTGADNSKAARAAGYSIEHAKRSGYRLAHDDRVQAAILEEGRKLMRSEGARSIQTLVAIRDDKGADAKDRIKCAVELLNRSGFHAVSEHHLNVEHRLSETEQDRRILALAAELGLPETEAQKLLIAPAEFQKNATGVYELAPIEPAEPSPHAIENREWRARRAGKSPEDWEADKTRRRAERAERMARERAEHEAARAAVVIDGERY